MSYPVVIGDLRDDPSLEIVVSVPADGVIVLLRHDGTVAGGFPIPFAGSPELRIGDVLLSNPGAEIIVVGNNGVGGEFTVVSGYGATLAGPFGQQINERACVLADLDGDGDDEIIAPRSQNLVGGVGALMAYHGDGQVVAGFPMAMPVQPQAWVWNRVFAADVNLDGRAEIAPITGGWPQTADVPFYLLDSSGNVLPGFPYTPSYGGQYLGKLAFGDLDGNHNLEIAGGGRLSLHGLDSDGTLHFLAQLIPDAYVMFPIIGNFDADANLEIAMGSAEQAYVFDPDTLAIIGQTQGPHRECINVTAGDVNGDGIDELAVWFSQFGTQGHNTIHLIDVTTMSNLPGWPMEFTPLGSPLPTSSHAKFMNLEDLDRDGDLEVICVGGSSIYVWDEPNPGAPVSQASWPTFRGNYARNCDYYYGRRPQPKLIRGDVNRDGVVDLSDVVRQIEYFFLGGTTVCPLAMDTNADAALDLGDTYVLLNYQFLSGAPPEPPFPECEPVPNTPDCLVFECP